MAAASELDLNVEGITPEECEMLRRIHSGEKLDLIEAEHVAPTRGLTREEWLAIREREAYQGIGGSEAAAVVGLNPYESPFTVFVRKRGRDLGWKVPEMESEEENSRTRWGTLLEPLIRQEAQRELRQQGRRFVIVEYKWLLRHRLHPEIPMFANLDGLIYDVETKSWGLFEAKTTRDFLRDEWFPNRIPIHYLIQCLHYLAVLGPNFRWGLVAVLIGGSEPQYRLFERNDALIETLIAQEQAFWKRHIETLEPPKPMGLEREMELMNEIFPPDPSRLPLVLPPEARELLQELEEQKARIRAAEERKKQIEAQLRLLMGNHPYADVPEMGVRLSLQTRKRTGVDVDKLREDGLYDQYKKETTYSVLTVGKIPAKRVSAS